MEATLTDKAYKTSFEKLADLKDHIGKEIGLSEWIPIEQDRVDAFAETTEDMQWIHTNPTMAKQFSPYGAPVAHGFLVLSLIPKVSYETIEIKDVVMGVNYGVDKVRFPNATKVGSKVRARISLTDYEELPTGARYRARAVFELDGEEKPACVADLVAQAYTGSKEQAAQVQQLNTMAAAKQTEDSSEVVLYEVQDNVALITLNRPDNYNGITYDLLNGLEAALWKVRDDNNVRAAVLTGNGRGFCAGADMSDLSSKPQGVQTTDFLNTHYLKVINQLVTIGKPIIAAIHGSAAGAGTAFALGADFRVMADTASFAFVFSNIALNTDAGSGWLLQRLVGYSRALQYTLEANKIPADECLNVGLTNKVVPEDKLVEEAMTWAKSFAQKAPIAMASQKEILQHASQNDFVSTFHLESKNQAMCMDSEDFMEGVMAFKQKRKPEFKGK